MTLAEVLCFGAAPGQGNLAQVIEHDGWDMALRQAHARAGSANACVFVGGGPRPVLDYYYPHARSPLCLHATLAAARVLFDRMACRSLEVVTAQDGLPLRLTDEDGLIFVGLAPRPAPAVTVSDELLAQCFDKPPVLAAPACVASVGSPKLLLRVADAATLGALQPRLERIVEWGRAHGVNGVYAWCELADGSLAGRNFNHLDPAMEDSATGVAAGALALRLRRDLVLRQGANIGKPCVLQARYSAGEIRVGGAAERLPAPRH